MEYAEILYEVSEGVATVTLNRPEKLNAMTARMGVELGAAMAQADEDDDVRVVILTGAGRAFCAGADLGGGGDKDKGQWGAGWGEAKRPARSLLPMDVRKPVIAAMNGSAVGVGLTWPLQADVRYVAEDAKLAFAFVRRGVTPELASHAILPRLTGLSTAAELLFTGRTFSGREAAELGVASKALPADQVLPAARELAREIATWSAPVSVAIAKRLLWGGLTAPVADVRRAEGEVFGWVSRQPDAPEGVRSFFEKREPKWTMSPTRDLPDDLGRL